MTIQAALDLPIATEPADPLNLRVQGWVYATNRQTEIKAVEVLADGRAVGRTSLLYVRPDVCAAVGLPSDMRTGFSLVGTAPDLVAASTTTLDVRVVFADGSTAPVASRDIRLSGRDYRKGDWGILVDPAFPHLVRREHMYNSGPSLDAPSTELLALLDRYLPAIAANASGSDPAPTVLDIGCGRGPYARPLQERGYDWLGVELKQEDCAELATKGLPHRQVDGRSLPFEDGTFDVGICIEVLEHTADPWSFVAEARRVLRKRLIVSVPNLEVVTYWRPHLAVPWHLLEADHKNFFSRASLRELLGKHFRSVEVVTYGQAPLRTAEGAAVDYHLLAIADV